MCGAYPTKAWEALQDFQELLEPLVAPQFREYYDLFALSLTLQDSDRTVRAVGDRSKSWSLGLLYGSPKATPGAKIRDYQISF